MKPRALKHEGQPFFDREIVKTHRLAGNTTMRQAVAAACGNQPPRPIHEPTGQYQRVRLTWIKPGDRHD